jgi:uncharacterized protein DUF5615
VKLRLYFDEDSLTHGLVVALRARGMDVATALEAGMLERSDEEHLAYATAEGRTLFTFNIADFSRIHSSWLSAARNHASLILAPQQRYSIGEQLRRLLKLTAARSAEDMVNRAEFLSMWS